MPLAARVAKLVDAADLKSAGHCDHAGSIPAPGTTIKNQQFTLLAFPHFELTVWVIRNRSKCRKKSCILSTLAALATAQLIFLG